MRVRFVGIDSDPGGPEEHSFETDPCARFDSDSDPAKRQPDRKVAANKKPRKKPAVVLIPSTQLGFLGGIHGAPGAGCSLQQQKLEATRRERERPGGQAGGRRSGEG